MIHLTEEQIFKIHSQMIAKTGGSDGVRDKGLLDSALNTPFQTFGGTELYPDIMLKAAVLCRSIVCNHPFIDGNKRTGVQAMLVFLEINHILIEYTQADLIEFGLSVASGKYGIDEIFQWLTKHYLPLYIISRRQHD